MSSRRFIINSRSIRNGFASYDGELFHHIVRVLRLSPGDAVILVDENGGEHSGVIDQLGREWVTVKISQSSFSSGQEAGAPRVTICQALPKGDRIDLILQKGTELGAHDFRLFGGTHSVARIREDQQDNKLARWNRITAEAARQCGRRTVPPVHWFPSAAEAAQDARHDLKLLLWEGERNTRLRKVLGQQLPGQAIIVAIGPEGGFDAGEVLQFTGQGFQPVSLGSRILRTETVSIAIMSILQYIFDDI